MTQRRFALLAVGGLFTAVAGVAWGGTVEFQFDASDFTSPTAITNDYWGLRLGGPSSAVYFSEATDGCEVSQSVVAGTTGSGFFAAPYDIDAVVVHDREWVDAECSGDYVLVEDTFDWYAQDDDANVWYLGEDTTSFDEEAECLSTGGAWKAGVDGAAPGVIMLADPEPGVAHQQELFEGEAEDWARVLRLNAPVSIEFGDYADCLVTKEYTPLSPGTIEHKFYCPLSDGGFGLMLVEEMHGKTRRVEYIGAALPQGDFPDEFPVPPTETCRE